MDKKVVIIISAVLAFFAGAIWVSEVPVVATLVACLEVCAGFGCGFYYHKVKSEEVMKGTIQEIESLKDAFKKIKEEKADLELTLAAQKTPKKVRTDSKKK